MPYLPRAMVHPPPLADGPPRSAPEPRTVLLVNPFYPKDPHGSFGKHALTPALALTSLAAATPPGWRVALWDENLLQGAPPADPPPQVVGITVHLTFAERAWRLARWFRARGSKVVVGGPHVTSCPEEAVPHADAVVVGDGVGVWADVLRDLDAGRAWPRYDGSYLRPHLADQPEPARELVDRGSFLTTASVIAGRGCRNRCRFCVLSTRGVRVPYQARRAEQVVSAIRASGEPYAVFLDNNLGADPDDLAALCRALEPLEIIWSAAISLDVTDRPALVRAMARAGCTGVFVGFESVNPASLAEAGKASPPPSEYRRRVDLLHDHGIQVNGSFVLGFDHDGPEVFERTVGWIESARLECATFHILTPYPGTPLFERLEAEGRLLHRDWARYDTAHAVFRPRRMSPGQLEEGYAWCYRRLFSPASIWARRPVDPAAVPGYLASTLLYKKCNRLWVTLIRSRAVHRAWRPLVEAARRRHLRSRGRFAAAPSPAVEGLAEPVR